MNPTILFLAMIGAAGGFLVVDGLFGLIPKPRPGGGGLDGAARARALGAGERERITILAQAPLLDRLLAPVLEDLVGRVGEQQRQDVAARLRRSGWKYRTVADYYATRVLLAGMFFVAGGIFLLISGASYLFWVPLALGLLGYFIPDREVRAAISARRNQMQTEMAFSLDRLALLLRAGIAVQEAIGLLTEAPGGPFLAALRKVSRTIGAGGTGESVVERALEEFESDLPQDPEVQQFTSRIRLGLEGTPIADSLLVQGERMRAAINARLLKRGLQTVLAITTIGAAFMLPALGILILGPPLMLAFNLF